MLKLSLPLNKNAVLIPAIIFVIAVCIYFLPQNIESLLIYDRNDIANGQWWRVLTGHLVHTNFNHLLLNLAGLIMLWALHGDDYSPKSYTIVFILSALVCSLGIYLFTPEMHRYVGLSGVLHGIFVWGAINDIKKGWNSGYLLLIGVWGKVFYEQIFGASADVEAMINASVAIDAHLWGAVGGLIYPLFEFIKSKSLGTDHN
ncbi:rhombosortase [Colwelliaceae bacterium BS250]